MVAAFSVHLINGVVWDPALQNDILRVIGLISGFLCDMVSQRRAELVFLTAFLKNDGLYF